MMTIGEKIRKLRMDHGLTQVKFAAMIKTAPQQVCRWERGVNIPSLESLLNIAHVLAIDERDLIEGDSPKQHTKEEALLLEEIADLSTDEQLFWIVKFRKWKSAGRTE